LEVLKNGVPEQRCRRGRANSARISARLSEFVRSFMARRRRTQDNDQSDCDRSFSNYVRSAFWLVALAGFRVCGLRRRKYFMLRQERRFDDRTPPAPPKYGS